MNRVSAEEMSELESIMIERFNVSEEALMELAGEKLAKFIGEEFSRNLKIAVIIGKGGNGGDGVVTARRLHDKGYDIQVHTPYEKDKLSELTASKFEGLDEDLIDPHFPSANVYVDALVGYNLSGELREPVLQACDKINEWNGETVSVDVPTGLDVENQKIDDKGVSPDYTVALGALKYGMASTNCGEIHVGDIGIMNNAFEELGLKGPDFEDNNIIRVEK